jgi:hypothetical protein
MRAQFHLRTLRNRQTNRDTFRNGCGPYAANACLKRWLRSNRIGIVSIDLQRGVKSTSFANRSQTVPTFFAPPHKPLALSTLSGGAYGARTRDLHGEGCVCARLRWLEEEPDE